MGNPTDTFKKFAEDALATLGITWNAGHIYVLAETFIKLTGGFEMTAFQYQENFMSRV